LGGWNESQIYIALPVWTDVNCLRLQINYWYKKTGPSILFFKRMCK